VAAAAGVSMALVSRALNGRDGVSDTTRARIKTVADDLGYTAHPGARVLRTGRSDMFGIVARNLSNPFFLDVLVSAQMRADAGGRTIMTVDSHYSVDREIEHIRRMASQRFDGLAVAPTGSGQSIRVWRRQRPSSPIVVLNARATKVAGVLHVGPDDEAAVNLAVEHLRELGHRRIGFLTAPRDVVADRTRLDAASALASAGGRNGLSIIETALDPATVQETIRSVLQAPRPPTAVITSSDHTAQSVYVAAREVGATVGGDLSVVGHDDLATSALLDPPLTTLRISRSSIGHEIVKRLSDPRLRSNHVEPVSLVVRQSTSALA
jgi:DNA-binding LacI/PurR family transcriptional regulator